MMVKAFLFQFPSLYLLKNYFWFGDIAVSSYDFLWSFSINFHVSLWTKQNLYFYILIVIIVFIESENLK